MIIETMAEAAPNKYSVAIFEFLIRIFLHETNEPDGTHKHWSVYNQVITEVLPKASPCLHPCSNFLHHINIPLHTQTVPWDNFISWKSSSQQMLRILHIHNQESLPYMALPRYLQETRQDIEDLEGILARSHLTNLWLWHLCISHGIAATEIRDWTQYFSPKACQIHPCKSMESFLALLS